MTEDDLNYYYDLVETLWLSGFGIRDVACPGSRNARMTGPALTRLFLRENVRLGR